MHKIKQQIEKFGRDYFNNAVLKATYKAQKKYGFDMTKHEYSYSNTHNNDADAFKHACYTSIFLIIA